MATTDPEISEPRRPPVRVLIAKPGLDGHDRGAKVLVRALRDAGFEVVYTGLFQTPEMIASAALQEDVQVIGLSILSGAHWRSFRGSWTELQSRGLDDVLVVAGGTIPKADIPQIKALGVAEVFGPAPGLTDIVEYIRAMPPGRHHCGDRRSRSCFDCKRRIGGRCRAWPHWWKTTTRAGWRRSTPLPAHRPGPRRRR